MPQRNFSEKQECEKRECIFYRFSILVFRYNIQLRCKYILPYSRRFVKKIFLCDKYNTARAAFPYQIRLV